MSRKRHLWVRVGSCCWRVHSFGCPNPVSMEILLAACSRPNVPGGRAALGVRVGCSQLWPAWLPCPTAVFRGAFPNSSAPRLPRTCLFPPSGCSLCWEGPLHVSPRPASPHRCPHQHLSSLGQQGHHFNASLALFPSFLWVPTALEWCPYPACHSRPFTRFLTSPALSSSLLGCSSLNMWSEDVRLNRNI